MKASKLLSIDYYHFSYFSLSHEVCAIVLYFIYFHLFKAFLTSVSSMWIIIYVFLKTIYDKIKYHKRTLEYINWIFRQ